MCDEKKNILPEENEPKTSEEKEEAAVLYDPSELSDDDLGGLNDEELDNVEGAGYFFVPVLVAANINIVANVNAGANANVAANAMAAANAVAAANTMGVVNANAMTNINVTD